MFGTPEASWNCSQDAVLASSWVQYIAIFCRSANYTAFSLWKSDSSVSIREHCCRHMLMGWGLEQGSGTAVLWISPWAGSGLAQLFWVKALHSPLSAVWLQNARSSQKVKVVYQKLRVRSQSWAGESWVRELLPQCVRGPGPSLASEKKVPVSFSRPVDTNGIALFT